MQTRSRAGDVVAEGHHRGVSSRTAVGGNREDPSCHEISLTAYDVGERRGPP